MTKYNCGTHKKDSMNVFPVDNYIQFHIEYNGDQRIDDKRLNLSMEDTKDLIAYLQSIVDGESKAKVIVNEEVAKMLGGVEDIRVDKNTSMIHWLECLWGELFGGIQEWLDANNLTEEDVFNIYRNGYEEESELLGFTTSELIEELKKRKGVESTRADFSHTTKIDVAHDATILVIPDKR